MRAEDLRRWTRQRELAARREADELRGHVPPPEQAFEHGLRMIALAGRLHGWPLPEDESERREDLAAYRRWALLRTRMMARV